VELHAFGSFFARAVAGLSGIWGAMSPPLARFFGYPSRQRRGVRSRPLWRAYLGKRPSVQRFARVKNEATSFMEFGSVACHSALGERALSAEAIPLAKITRSFATTYEF